MTMIARLTLTICMLSVSLLSEAQDKPRASLPDTARSGTVEVAYSRPLKKGRVVFGELVPYGQVWRTGANEATQITLKKDCTFAGKPVKKGTYTLFTIPEKDKWTIILNTQLKQWGAFSYEKYKDKDILVATVPARKTKEVVEKFTIDVTDKSVNMAWENTSVSIPVR